MSVSKKAARLGLSTNLGKLRTHEEYENILFEKEIDCYPLEQYINTDTPILHECLAGHTWKAAPTSIINSRRTGCPTCAASGFREELPAILYYISITTKYEVTYYKLGITNRTVAKRFERDKDKIITVLAEKYFDKGRDAKLRETELLNTYSKHRVFVPNLLRSGGNSELFEYDIQPSL